MLASLTPPSNFTNPSPVQIVSAIVSREGVFDAEDNNITPNMTAGDLVSSWKNNNGMTNTFVGGTLEVTSETSTTISSSGVFVDLLGGNWAEIDLQHTDSPSDGRLRHSGVTPREFKLSADLSVDGTQNADLSGRVMKRDFSSSTDVVVFVQNRQVNNFTGGRDVAFFTISTNLKLDQNDYVYLQVANNSNTSNVTLEDSSYYTVEER